MRFLWLDLRISAVITWDTSSSFEVSTVGLLSMLSVSVVLVVFVVFLYGWWWTEWGILRSGFTIAWRGGRGRANFDLPFSSIADWRFASFIRGGLWGSFCGRLGISSPTASWTVFIGSFFGLIMRLGEVKLLRNRGYLYWCLMGSDWGSFTL